MRRPLAYPALALLVATFTACGSSSIGGDEPDAPAGSRPDGGGGACVPQTCAELGWACGKFQSCGLIIDCAQQGLACGDGQLCVGGIDGPTTCTAGGGGAGCDVCDAIPDCSAAAQPTRLRGRVVTAGRTDGSSGNQVGVPNALVYILRSNDPADLPDLPAGVPAGGTRCGRCEDEVPQLGPVLAGAVSNDTGDWEIAGDVPVGEEITLVVKAGRFRRATHLTLRAQDACTNIQLPETVATGNPTRLPRHMADGLRVNIPKIAVTTGRIDAMECVLLKMGLQYPNTPNANCSGQICEFGNPGSAARVHLYRGRGPDATGSGARGGTRIDSNTPNDDQLYGSLAKLEEYDMVVADCEGRGSDASNYWNFADRDANGAKVRSYLNRGGRLFASHLSFSWLHGNGSALYADVTDKSQTGLAPAATWEPQARTGPENGPGLLAFGSPVAAPRLAQFGQWLIGEGVIARATDSFNILDPRSQVIGRQLGASTEEYVYCTGGDCDTAISHQFSFNTPYGAPADAACGRVVYSGFHVVAASGDDTYQSSLLPADCGTDLTAQEKVLLYMLFDLGACLGNPLPPTCTPRVCARPLCNFVPDGCGDVIDCGPCLLE